MPAEPATSPDPIARLAAVRRYAGPPTDGDIALERIARMAAKVFATSMATVSVVDEEEVRFLAQHGLDPLPRIGLEPGLATSALHHPGPYVVTDAGTDPRTADHPLVRGDLGLRFYAAATITMDGQALGTVDVMDRTRHRRVSAMQTELLSDLAATVADLLSTRRATLTALRVEQAGQVAEADRRQQAERANEQHAGLTPPGAERPRWCQLGGTAGCPSPAEAKVADSWGDSAWGCWPHAEEALINVVPVFLASESPAGLAAYRARVTPAP